MLDSRIGSGIIVLALLIFGCVVMAYEGVGDNSAIVVVHWGDITSTPSWNVDQEPGVTHFATVGFLVEDSDSLVTIATTWDKDELVYRDFHSFPKSDPTLEVVR
jgi:hypothetical protein